MADVCCVDEKEKWAKDRALRNTTFDMIGTSRLACELNILSTVCKIGANAVVSPGYRRM